MRLFCLGHRICKSITFKMEEVHQISINGTSADGKVTGSNQSDVKIIPGVRNFGKGDAICNTLPTSVNSETYNMGYTKRGVCVIFNHEKFESCRNLSERKGTDVDAKTLEVTFRSLGFNVVSYKDCTADTVIKTLRKLSQHNHWESDCFVCCVLTHGRDDLLYCREGVITVEDVLKPFLADVCPSLVGKPKIFFLQACRGDRLDRGVPVVETTTDSSSSVFKLPSQADFLACYSTTPGYLSWRNEGRGSWFIQAVCKTLNEWTLQMDLLSLMTVVSRRVAYDFESYDRQNRDLCGMKQMPITVSTLTRKIFLYPKALLDDTTFDTSSSVSSSQQEQAEKHRKKERRGCMLC